MQYIKQYNNTGQNTITLILQVYERRKPQHLSVCISRKLIITHNRTGQYKTEYFTYAER